MLVVNDMGRVHVVRRRTVLVHHAQVAPVANLVEAAGLELHHLGRLVVGGGVHGGVTIDAALLPLVVAVFGQRGVLGSSSSAKRGRRDQRRSGGLLLSNAPFQTG